MPQGINQGDSVRARPSDQALVASDQAPAGLGPSGFDPSRGVFREAFVFTVPGQVAKMCLPDGFRFVCLVRGSQPKSFPINEPGMWEIDIPALLAKGKYPVVVTTVDAAHVAAFEKLPVAVVNDMLAAIAMEARRGATTGATAEGGDSAGPQDIAQ